MRLLLDEMLPPSLAVALRERGVDAAAVSGDPALEGRADAEVLEAAARAGRAVVTLDVRHFRILAGSRLSAGAGHAGLVLISAVDTPPTFGWLLDELETLARGTPDGVADREVWL